MRVLPFLIVLAACGGPAEPEILPTDEGAVTEAEPAAAPEAEIPDTPVGATLSAYEELRKELFHDRLEGAHAAATTLAAQAEEAAEASPDHAAHLTQLHDAATRAAEAEDLEMARAAYGEVSRAVIGMQIADPALQEGWHIYTCPMVEGFQKWSQPRAGIQNPYMGQEMPRCGGATEWAL